MSRFWGADHFYFGHALGNARQRWSLTHGDHNVDCGKIMLKSEFLKKA
ncbi:hypothetical protein HMPREF9996_01999 [Aggregatibacter actinomycetemcomitans Y4]|nr:hypothetical protein HMPREF9996_01999 [Aggregatibacter actinomycetemcomitans Y4]